jgi:pimeloyl-ACP methyl ester carboxylesterase
MKLHFQKLGNGPVLIILHGLYGMSDNWITFARQLAESFTVYLIDQRNHGRSPHDNEHSYLAMSSDLNELIISENLDKVIVLGHSMGGKTAMLYTVRFPEKVLSLIVVDIAPVNYSSVDSYNHQVITHLNIINAMLSVDFTKMNNRIDINNELEKIIKDDTIRQFIMKNVHRNSEGIFAWKLNVNAISRALPEMMSYPGKYAELQLKQKIPVLFIRGGQSGYIMPEYVTAIKTIFPTAQIETIPNAGHWVHADQPVLFMQTVKDFLDVK